MKGIVPRSPAVLDALLRLAASRAACRCRRRFEHCCFARLVFNYNSLVIAHNPFEEGRNVIRKLLKCYRWRFSLTKVSPCIPLYPVYGVCLDSDRSFADCRGLFTGQFLPQHTKDRVAFLRRLVGEFVGKTDVGEACFFVEINGLLLGVPARGGRARRALRRSLRRSG